MADRLHHEVRRRDWESYRIVGLELHGRHRSKAEAAASLAQLGQYEWREH
jgi:hypothetical protein